ncbi:MAG: GDP-mannose 4,6-dehydratase [Phycisphaerales bacterium]|nr:GDP-mannose 4,6-dehydratase [Phycisphaerales bacterium]
MSQPPTSSGSGGGEVLGRIGAAQPKGNAGRPTPARPPRRALITGITGQDGSYLAEFLIAKGYQVHGIIRRASLFNTARIDHIYIDPHAIERDTPGMILHHGDVTDANIMERLVRSIGPDEVYNLAAQSHVRVSFEMPIHTAESVAMGAMKLLEAVRDYQQVSGQRVRYYQASSSEMFGKVAETPQRETTAFRPRSPYAVAKTMAHFATVNYREAYGLHASCGILFNHESPRRGETFVTRKITRAVGRIKMGLQSAVYLGNLDARRDWGFAGDYVEAMWMMLQQPKGDDYVVATGRSYSVREFAELAFAEVGLNARDHVRFDERYTRPSEVEELCGDWHKAKSTLGWKPKTELPELVRMMVENDLELARREKTLRDAGHDVGAAGRSA